MQEPGRRQLGNLPTKAEIAGFTGRYLEIEGFKDGIVDGALIGWVWDEFDADVYVTVEIYHDDALLATIPADSFRQDLLDAGKGDGCHAFSYALPPALTGAEDSAFRVSVAETGVELFKGPLRYTFPRSNIPSPPHDLIVATGHPCAELFAEHGADVAIVCRKYGRLRSNGWILDMGCGVGRLAVPLTAYLGSNGRYEGIDIMPAVIDWCRSNISSKFSNFQFHHADIHSKYYNATGRVLPADYRFPYETETFDVVFLGSVFTHLLPRELTHYLSEITRVLRSGGRCLISYFLLEDGVLKNMTDKSQDADFKYEGSGCRTTNREVAEASVAYEETFIRRTYAEYGLTTLEPIHYGAQDLVVAAKAT